MAVSAHQKETQTALVTPAKCLLKTSQTKNSRLLLSSLFNKKIYAYVYIIYLRNSIDQQSSTIQHHHECAEQDAHLNSQGCPNCMSKK